MKPTVIAPSTISRPEGLTLNRLHNLLIKAGYVPERSNRMNSLVGLPPNSSARKYRLPAALLPNKAPHPDYQKQFIEALWAAEKEGKDLAKVWDTQQASRRQPAHTISVSLPVSISDDVIRAIADELRQTTIEMCQTTLEHDVVVELSLG